MVVGLDYENPYLNPYEEFQKWKTHPEITKVLKGGTCIEYGARTLNEGGYHAIPNLSFPGGTLAGCSAGFMNVAQIKASHNAMKTGMIAAETIFDQVKEGGLDSLQGANLKDYEGRVLDSWVGTDLKKWRNFKQGFEKGLWFGLAHGALVSLTQGKEPWTLTHSKLDSKYTADKSSKKAQPIDYPKPDGKITFDLLSNLQRSGTMHDDDQPSHLKVTSLH